MKTGIIFDVDGTLWDACEQITESWNMVFDKYPHLNIHIDYETAKGLMGKQIRDIATELMEEPDDKLIEILMDECCASELEYIVDNHPGRIFPGVVDTLKELKKKYFIGIVSNCMDGYIEALIKYYGLEDTIDAHLCAGSSETPKVSNIKKIIKDNNIDRAFYVGDTMGDCIASKEAGARFIFAAYGFGKVENVPSVDDITELPELIEKLITECN